MTAQGADSYSHARHISRVQAAARAAGIKGAAYAVLSYMCSVSDFHRPTVCVSKERIAERTAYSVKSVKAALGALRDAGLLVAVAYETGGRHRATVYTLKAGAGQAENGGRNFPPNAEKGGKFSAEKGGSFGHKRGEETSPPSEYLPEDTSRGTGGASRAGRNSRPLDAGASPGPRAGADLDREEMGRFARDVTLHGYGEARRLQQQRQAERGAG